MISLHIFSFDSRPIWDAFENELWHVSCYTCLCVWVQSLLKPTFLAVYIVKKTFKSLSRLVCGSSAGIIIPALHLKASACGCYLPAVCDSVCLSLTSPTELERAWTIFSCAVATTLCPLISIILWPTRTPPLSAMPPRIRLHIWRVKQTPGNVHVLIHYFEKLLHIYMSLNEQKDRNIKCVICKRQ